jgi:hypothetical protein
MPFESLINTVPIKQRGKPNRLPLLLKQVLTSQNQGKNSSRGATLSIVCEYSLITNSLLTI